LPAHLLVAWFQALPAVATAVAVAVAVAVVEPLLLLYLLVFPLVFLQFLLVATAVVGAPLAVVRPFPAPPPRTQAPPPHSLC
jgi:hypothetical protein